MSKIRLTVEMFFPDDREEYTDPYGRPHKILDAKHWTGWVKQAMLSASDGAMRRCDAQVSVSQNPELEPVWVKCPECGEHTRINCVAAVDAEMFVGEYPKGYSADGYVTVDWEDNCKMDFTPGTMNSYQCEHCKKEIFPDFAAVEAYLEERRKKHGN